MHSEAWAKSPKPEAAKSGRQKLPLRVAATEDGERRALTGSDTTSRHRVSMGLSLFDLAMEADRAGLFCNFSPEPNTGCYLWTGRTTKQGYGVVSINRKTITVHRAVYRLCVEEVSDDLDVHHVCEQPGCIYPEHLTALTPEQHRRVHCGLGRAWNVFVERVRPDPFATGAIGLPIRPILFDHAAGSGKAAGQPRGEPLLDSAAWVTFGGGQ